MSQPGVAGQPNATTPASGLADPTFAQRLQAALSRTGSTQVFFPQTRSTVNVMNQNGVVTLQGNVSSLVEKQSIEARVRDMQGVTSINDQLKVMGPSQNGLGSPAQTNINNRQLLNP